MRYTGRDVLNALNVTENYVLDTLEGHDGTVALLTNDILVRLGSMARLQGKMLEEVTLEPQQIAQLVHRAIEFVGEGGILELDGNVGNELRRGVETFRNVMQTLTGSVEQA